VDHYIFRGMTDEHRELLGRMTQRRSVPAGTVLFRQGEPGDTALFIERGRVELSLRLPGGGHLPLAEVGGGELLGELAVAGPHRREATAEVVEALEMHRDDLRALCAVCHPASLVLMRRLARLVARRLLRIDEERVPETAAEDADVHRERWRSGAAFEVRRFLPALSFFETFPPLDLDAILALGRIWTVAAGETLLRHADPPGGCFVLLRGAVKVTVPAPGGPRRLAVLGPGALFGEIAPLLERPRSATCAVREPATLLELAPEAFAALRDPAHHVSFRFHEALLRSLMQRLEQANRALAGERRLRGS